MSTTNSLLSSIAETEVALAHVIDAEAKKLKTIIGDDNNGVADFMKANKSAERMLRKIITKEMLLSFQLEDVVELEGVDALRPLYPIRIAMPINIEHMTVGRAVQLQVILYPFNAINRIVTWSSSDPIVATVSHDGLVTAHSAGPVTITAQTANNLTATAHIIVEDIYPVSIGLNRTTMNLGISRSEQLRAILLPSTATVTGIIWSSNEMAVASVNADGLVTAHAQGNARITAETANNLTAHCDVVVSPVLPTSIEVVPAELTLEVGNSHTLFANILPNDTTYKNVIWTSANNEIASVSPERIVTAHQVGIVYINAMMPDGPQAQCRVIVT